MKKESNVYYKSAELLRSKETNDPWRQLMIQWMCAIVDVFELSNQIVSVAVYYLDNAVAKDLVQSPQDYKLAALTSLQLAIKVYDHKLFPLEQLLSISQADLSVIEAVDAVLLCREAALIGARAHLLHLQDGDRAGW